MRLIEIAVGTVLRIPESWDAFVFNGWRYRMFQDRAVRKGRVKNAA